MPSGPPVLGFGRYLRHEQLLPYLRIQETLADRGGAGPGVGTLHPAGVPAALARGPVETARKAALTAAHLVPAAETGRRVANRGVWVPVACTARLTHQAWQATRGRLATAASGILPHFRGCRSHDAWAASWAGCCQHGRCKAPRLRARTAVAAAPGPTWARAVHTLLRAMSRAVLRGRAAGLTSSPAARLATFVQRYQRLLHLGEAATPPPQRHPAGPTRGRRNQRKARTLRARLRAHADAVLACLVAWPVPFDTHQAERDRRLRTVQQQISGTCRDPASAAACGRRRSSSATLRKQGQALLPALTRTLRGQPPWPALAPE